MNTLWWPHRYFLGTTLYGFALGAYYQHTGSNDGRAAALAFVKNTFGVKKPRQALLQ